MSNKRGSRNALKRFIALLLVFVLCLGLLGCGKKEESKEKTDDKTEPVSEATPTEATEDNAEPTEEAKPSEEAADVVMGTDLSYDGYTEVWKDEFDGDSLNRDDWNVELHDPGWVNAELQAYVDSEENIFVKDGCLYLNPVKNGEGDSATYTSGRVNTQNKHDFKYGLFEATIKVPEGQGYLPAFWLMPTDENLYGQWPKCGEIDAAEVMGQNTNKLYGTIHYGEPHAEQQGTYELSGVKSFSETFHTFAVEWEPDRITWYVDGNKYHEANDWFTAVQGGGEITYPAPFDQPFYVILNLAVGGSWVGNPDANTSFENNAYVIDSVKVYQKDAAYYEEKEANAVKPEKVITYREPDENGNYIIDGVFANAITPASDWTLHLEDDGKGSEVKTENNQAIISQAKEGGVPYSVQLKQQGFPLYNGCDYTLTFDAKADEARSIIVDIEGPNKDWVRYLEDTAVDLTTEMKTYTLNFTMDADTDPDVSLEFNLGNQGSTAGVTIANVSLVVSGGEAKAGTSAKKVRADGNYVYNGAFEEGKGRLGFWEIGEADAGNISVTNVNNERRLKVVAPEGTSADKPVIIKQSELPITAGKYVLSYKAYKEDAAADEKTLTISVGGLEVNDVLTAAEKEYESAFEYKAGAGTEIVINFTAPGTYYVDDIFVGEDALVKNGSFNAGMSGFTQYTYNTAKADYTVDSLSEDNAFAITINDTGTEDWHVQLFQDGVKLEKGKKYRLSFKAKSNMDRSIRCALQHNGSADDNWEAYMTPITAVLTSEYQTFSAEFEMTYESDPVARLDFGLGVIDKKIQTGHSIFIDDIVLEEI